MSTKYKSPKDVPLNSIIARLLELSGAISDGRDSQSREFTMRIPAECDRDADIVISQSAMRLDQARQIITDLVQYAECNDPGNPHIGRAKGFLSGGEG
jgi:hypothetical protein